MRPADKACTSIRDGKWLTSADEFLPALKADPVLHGLCVEFVKSQGKEASIFGKLPLAPYLYKAAAAAFLDADPAIVAKGPDLSHAGSRTFWDAYTKEKGSLTKDGKAFPFDGGFKNVSQRCLLNAEVRAWRQPPPFPAHACMRLDRSRRVRPQTSPEQAVAPTASAAADMATAQALRKLQQGHGTAADVATLRAAPYQVELSEFLANVTQPPPVAAQPPPVASAAVHPPPAALVVAQPAVAAQPLPAVAQPPAALAASAAQPPPTVVQPAAVVPPAPLDQIDWLVKKIKAAEKLGDKSMVRRLKRKLEDC